MKIFLLLTLIVFSILWSCSKSEGDTSPIVSKIDTVGTIWLVPYKYGNGADTGGNYMAEYHFYQSTIYPRELRAQYFASQGSGTHVVRFIGSEPLWNVQPVDRGGTIIRLRVSEANLGRLIFETRDTATGQVFKTYIASKDSVVINASFSIWDNYVTPDTAISKALLYYIHEKQNDKIVYRVQTF